MTPIRRYKRLLIGVLSASFYEGRRGGCRRTWFGDLARREDVLPIFLIGRPEIQRPTLMGDELYLPCFDDYHHVSHKTFGFVSWALDEWDFDFLFKCDDDTYLQADRLCRYPVEGRDYVGGGRSEYASGGAGYFLSHRAAEIIRQSGHPSGLWEEDVLVGRILAGAGVHFRGSPQFEPFAGIGHAPSPDNAQVSTHSVDADGMLSIHRRF